MSSTGKRTREDSSPPATPSSRDHAPREDLPPVSHRRTVDSAGPSEGYSDQDRAGNLIGFRYGARIARSSTGQQFKSPSELWDADPFLHTATFVGAPWLDNVFVKDLALLDEYESGGHLPGGVPIGAVETKDWLLRLAVPTSVLFRPRNMAWDQVMLRWTKRVYQRIRRTPCTVLIPARWGFDTWAHRTEGGIGYVNNMANLDVRPWVGQFMVHDGALLFDKPQIPYEFRYLGKNTPYWFDNVRWERRARSRLGCLLPYQMLEADLLRLFSLSGRYVTLPTWWQRLESCRGCNVECPPFVSYVGSLLLRDHTSGWWVVAITEFVAKTAVFLLWDVYDNYRLWYVQPTMRQFLRQLDLSLVLGSRDNAAELLDLLGIIDTIDWSAVLSSQSDRGSRRQDLSPGRVGSAGDYVYYDPWSKEVINRARAAELMANPLAMPANHPRGYVFEPEVGLGNQDLDDLLGDDVEYDEEAEVEDASMEPAGPVDGREGRDLVPRED